MDGIQTENAIVNDLFIMIDMSYMSYPHSTESCMGIQMDQIFTLIVMYSGRAGTC